LTELYEELSEHFRDYSTDHDESEWDEFGDSVECWRLELSVSELPNYKLEGVMALAERDIDIADQSRDSYDERALWIVGIIRSEIEARQTKMEYSI
jgi:hypothetical protein